MAKVLSIFVFLLIINCKAAKCQFPCTIYAEIMDSIINHTENTFSNHYFYFDDSVEIKTNGDWIFHTDTIWERRPQKFHYYVYDSLRLYQSRSLPSELEKYKDSLFGGKVKKLEFSESCNLPTSNSYELFSRGKNVNFDSISTYWDTVEFRAVAIFPAVISFTEPLIINENFAYVYAHFRSVKQWKLAYTIIYKKDENGEFSMILFDNRMSH